MDGSYRCFELRLASFKASTVVSALSDSSFCPYASSKSALVSVAPLGCASLFHFSLQLLCMAASCAPCVTLIVLSSIAVGALWGPIDMCSALFGNRPRFIMLRRCLAPGPAMCNGHGAPSLLVRFHLKDPHVPQNSNVALSLTVHALMLCLPVACCVIGHADMVPALRGRGCALSLGQLLLWL